MSDTTHANLSQSDPDPMTALQRTAQAADGAFHHTQEATMATIEQLTQELAQLRHSITPPLEDAVAQAQSLGRQGLASVRQSAKEMRQRAQRLGEDTVNYVHHQPVQAMLIAAASGAVLMGLGTLLARAYRRPS